MTSRKDIIQVGKLIQDDLSHALGFPCCLYQESGYCKVVKLNDEGDHIRWITSTYDAKTLYKVVLDIIEIRRLLP